MLALIFAIVSAIAFLLAALKVKVDDLLLVDWGLFFLALAFVFSWGEPWVRSRRGP